jgi:hypothetical protein
MFDLNALSAWGTAAAAVFALLALFLSAWTLSVQTRQAHFSSNLDNLWHLEDAFGSANMLASRATAAKALQRRADHPLAQASAHQIGALCEVLDFFELVGYLVERRALDPDTAWMDFADWALSYWQAAEAYIRPRRHATPATFENYALLVARFQAIERGRKEWPNGLVPDAALTDLFAREAALDTAATH